MKIYGNLDLRTGDLYEDDQKIFGLMTVTNDTTRNAIVDPLDGQLAVTLSDYSLNMYDSTSMLWKKFSIVDPVQNVTQYPDSKDNITLSTGNVIVPLNTNPYANRTTQDFLIDLYFKGNFQNWDVIFRLTGETPDSNSFALTWNEYYGLCIHVADQAFKNTRIFPTTNAWHHFNIRQDYVNSLLEFQLDGFRIYTTPTIVLPTPTQLRLGADDVFDNYDTTSLWVSGFQGKICQFRWSNNINRNYKGNSFTLYPYREMPDELTELFLQPKNGQITDDSPHFAVPNITAPATYGDNDDSPFTSEITYDVLATQHRTFFHNNSSTTDLIFNLPPVQDQLILAFVRFNTASKNIKIRAQYTERIVGINGDATSIDLNYIKNDETTDNSLIILKGNDSGQWEITSIKGTWKNANTYV